MESQTFEQPPQTVPQPVPQQSRPQSNDVNAMSRRTSAAGRPRSPFLMITFCLGFCSWIISLISQAIVAATFINGNASVRMLWFGIIIQFILLVEILEVVISGMFAYGVQISIFAGLATVFAVQGADQNIYQPWSAQKAIGAGWLITALIDLLWIIYFTSPPDSHFLRLASKLTPFSGDSQSAHTPGTIEKVLTSQDAFILSPPNGSNNARPDADASKSPEHTSGYDLNDVELQRGVRIKSGGLWSNYTSSQPGGKRATMSSVVSDGAQGVEIEPNAQSTERERSVRRQSAATSITTPETPTQRPHSRGPQSKAPRMLPQPVVPVEPQSPQTQTTEEPIAQWRAEALFDYPGAADDPNELPLKKGEHLDIIDKSGKWWEAVTSAGRRGIAPSNYLRLLI